MIKFFISNHLASMFAFPAKGRADIAMISDIAGISATIEMGLPQISPVGLVVSQPLYIYFHQKNEQFVQEIDEVVQQMNASGQMIQLRRKFEQEYYNSIIPDSE